MNSDKSARVVVTDSAKTAVSTKRLPKNGSEASGPILVPLDGSALAEVALPHALAMAHLTSSSIMLLRAVRYENLFTAMSWMQPPAQVIQQMCETQLAQAREYLGDLKERLQAEGVPVLSMVDEEADTIADCVCRIARQLDANMVAMATHGRSGLGRWVLGSVAEQVLHASPVPVLLVRPTEAQGKGQQKSWPAPAYRSIFVPLDGSPVAEQALDRAAKLAARMGSTITLVSVVPHMGDFRWLEDAMGFTHNEAAWREQSKRLFLYLDGIRDRLQADGLKVETEVITGNPAEEIVRLSERGPADLLVMATHGSGGLKRLWLGSVALKVVQASRVPVLLVRAKQAREKAEQTQVAETST